MAEWGAASDGGQELKSAGQAHGDDEGMAQVAEGARDAMVCIVDQWYINQWDRQKHQHKPEYYGECHKISY
jgi:hypothetical protein